MVTHGDGCGSIICVDDIVSKPVGDPPPTELQVTGELIAHLDQGQALGVLLLNPLLTSNCFPFQAAAELLSQPAELIIIRHVLSH
jgi:hypothetical protein